MPNSMNGGKKRKSAKKGKRKPSAYNNFVKKYMHKHMKGEKGEVTKLMKKAAAEWRSLSDAEKKKHA
jgi:hypothetical protein